MALWEEVDGKPSDLPSNRFGEHCRHSGCHARAGWAWCSAERRVWLERLLPAARGKAQRADPGPLSHDRLACLRVIPYLLASPEQAVGVKGWAALRGPNKGVGRAGG
ncbi:hypothetical protein GCM10010280_51290 [Streptomyces pilosus]|uniref:Uncharacterized protein n=1 Tax=Streptomyces pilosus TaxID=28893 RepID=A0A918BZ20_9ACTN|nr:hypothetical protein GCM10010280_51290 [Streptomyces pilosus]